MDEIVWVLLEALISGILLWIAAKLTSVQLTLPAAAVTAGVAAAVSTAPVAGWFLSLVVMLTFVKKFSCADIWPDIILMVVVSYLVAFGAIVGLSGLVK
ncbi:MAG TPA: hypothetical protein DHU56_11485 [Marinobacter sp.]|jgi:hypothetical protein|nr:hypothetical protein [Marinobacter sp.]